MGASPGVDFLGKFVAEESFLAEKWGIIGTNEGNFLE